MLITKYSDVPATHGSSCFSRAFSQKIGNIPKMFTYDLLFVPLYEMRSTILLKDSYSGMCGNAKWKARSSNRIMTAIAQ